MKKRLSAVAAACLILASQSVSAAADWGYEDYNYDYNYDYNDYNYDYSYDNNYGYDDNNGYYDNTWTDDTQNGDQTGTDENGDNGQNAQNGTESGSDSSSSSESQVDIANNVPVNVLLEQSKIADKKFTIDMKLDTKSKITEIDMTIIYDSNVLKMTSAKVNKKAASKEGKGVAAETENGTIQYQFKDPAGSEYKDSFLTLNFEVVDPLEKASPVYTKVNSILDENSDPLSYRADGTIVQIAGAVEFDAKDDESMYSELRVAKSDKPISLESLGLQNVASVQLEDKKLASTDNLSITTLAEGLTNMTVEFTDGTKKYYRLVVSESSAPTVTPTVGTVSGDNAQEAVPDKAAVGSGEEVEPQAKDTDPGLTKKETHSSSKKKYMIIYILVLVALIAIIVEFFVFFGNPYAKTAAILKQRRNSTDDHGSEGFNGEPLSIPEREQYDDADESGFDDMESKTADGETDENFSDEDLADDGFEYTDDEEIADGDYYDAYDGYEDSSEPRPADISTVEGYDDFDDGDFDDSSEEGVVSIEEDDIDPDDRGGE